MHQGAGQHIHSHCKCLLNEHPTLVTDIVAGLGGALKVASAITDAGAGIGGSPGSPGSPGSRGYKDSNKEPSGGHPAIRASTPSCLQ